MTPLSSEQIAPPPARRAWLALALGAVVSGLALWLMAQSVNFNATILAITTSQLQFFALAFLVQLTAMLLSVVRWQVLLRPYPTRFLNLTQIYFVGHLLNTVLPIKLGTIARIPLAAESEKLNSGFVLGSVAAEKVLDLLALLLLLLVLTPFAPLPVWITGSLTASIVIVLLALGALVSARRLREPFLAWCARMETRLIPSRPQANPRLTNMMRGLLENLTNLTQRREAVAVIFWTGCLWLTAGAVNQLLFAALGLNLPWTATWFVMVALQFGTRVPALPANLGVFHYVLILALALYGVNESVALAYAILLHLVVFILPAFIGAVCALPVSARLMLLVTMPRAATDAERTS